MEQGWQLLVPVGMEREMWASEQILCWSLSGVSSSLLGSTQPDSYMNLAGLGLDLPTTTGHFINDWPWLSSTLQASNAQWGWAHHAPELPGLDQVIAGRDVHGRRTSPVHQRLKGEVLLLWARPAEPLACGHRATPVCWGWLCVGRRMMQSKQNQISLFILKDHGRSLSNPYEKSIFLAGVIQ